MKRTICKYCKQNIKEYPAKIKSYSQWTLITASNKSIRKYRSYVLRMEERYGIEHIPDLEEMLQGVSDENIALRQKVKYYTDKLIESYNHSSQLRKYEIFYRKFESFIKQKVATKLDLPVTNITQALFDLELKSQLIKHKFKL